MRFFLFLFFISFNSFAQLDTGTGALGACTDITFAAPAPGLDNVYDCTTVTLTNAPFQISDLADSTLPLVIKATGTVTINSINFAGQPGAVVGGQGGPGGGLGGDYVASGTNGLPAGQGGNTTTPAVCAVLLVEGSGGGGGSLVASGTAGRAGAINTGGTPTPGGTPGTPITLNITPLTQAGAGGASGESGCNAGGVENAGAGGGGGGSLKIAAAGDITLAGTITVKGGDGEDVATIGGGGGGGSGGVIILQSLGQINLGTLNADPGLGGTNASASTAEGDGGNGGDGRIILMDLDGSVPGTFSPTPITTPINGIPTVSTPSLKSDITCGTVAKNNERNNTFQMIAGFMFVMLIMMMTKTLSRIRMKI